MNSCEVDPAFPLETQAISDEILGGGAFVPGYERHYWDGCTHGFAVRGDMVSSSYDIVPESLGLMTGIKTNPKIKAGKEGVHHTHKFCRDHETQVICIGAFLASVAFFAKYL